MTGGKASRRIANIIDYEPSWFAEFGSAVGILLWALFVTTTEVYDVTGAAWILPAAGFLFGPLRLLALFHLAPMVRVVAAMFSVAWWGWIMITFFADKGVAPAHAGYAIGLLMDFLTVWRFSLIARRPHDAA